MVHKEGGKRGKSVILASCKEKKGKKKERKEKEKEKKEKKGKEKGIKREGGQKECEDEREGEPPLP